MFGTLEVRKKHFIDFICCSWVDSFMFFHVLLIVRTKIHSSLLEKLLRSNRCSGTWVIGTYCFVCSIRCLYLVHNVLDCWSLFFWRIHWLNQLVFLHSCSFRFMSLIVPTVVVWKRQGWSCSSCWTKSDWVTFLCWSWPTNKIYWVHSVLERWGVSESVSETSEIKIVY